MDKLKYKYSKELDYLKSSVLPIVDMKGKEHILSLIKHLEEEKGLFEEMNTPKKTIVKNWTPSKCPNCLKSFSEYEDCDDGYYDRAYNLIRCPYCGQLLDWY